MVKLGAKVFRTATRSSELNPVWDEQFEFAVHDLTQKVDLQLWDENTIKDMVLGSPKGDTRSVSALKDLQRRPDGNRGDWGQVLDLDPQGQLLIKAEWLPVLGLGAVPKGGVESLLSVQVTHVQIPARVTKWPVTVTARVGDKVVQSGPIQSPSPSGLPLNDPVEITREVLNRLLKMGMDVSTAAAVVGVDVTEAQDYLACQRPVALNLLDVPVMQQVTLTVADARDQTATFEVVDSQEPPVTVLAMEVPLVHVLVADGVHGAGIHRVQTKLEEKPNPPALHGPQVPPMIGLVLHLAGLDYTHGIGDAFTRRGDPRTTPVDHDSPPLRPPAGRAPQREPRELSQEPAPLEPPTMWVPPTAVGNRMNPDTGGSVSRRNGMPGSRTATPLAAQAPPLIPTSTAQARLRTAPASTIHQLPAGSAAGGRPAPVSVSNMRAPSPPRNGGLSAVSGWSAGPRGRDLVTASLPAPVGDAVVEPPTAASLEVSTRRTSAPVRDTL
mmetsp:Transcript_129079/g.294573  ORF Transcript_129079/g.294573 Transcript_129079/m.294573 type:complete len:497 (-) Transcript_129079:30-1520(-)